MNKKPTYIKSTFNFNSKIGAGIIDEIPLWSAPFGLGILNRIKIKRNIRALDIGFGTGFPLIEIAQRLGNSSTVFGIDPWKPSHIRAKQKINFYGIKNVKLINGEAERIPLPNNSIDLIVSNNGINNVSDIEKVFKECNRICKKGAQFIASINLNRTFHEFYDAFILSLSKFEMMTDIEKIYSHIYEKRKPSITFQKYFTDNGFKIEYKDRKEFTMRFADEEAFFNHTLIKIGFLKSWEELLNENERVKIFSNIRYLLRKESKKFGYLKMTVPYLIVTATKY